MGLVLRVMSLVLIASCSNADEQPVCMATAELEAALVDWYGEEPILQIDDTSILWASGKSGTWTVVMRKPDNESCVLDKGQNLREYLKLCV